MEKNSPSGAPSWGNIPNQACLPGGAFSVASRTAPPHSPPRPTPCPTLHSASRMAAYTPMDAYVGSRPMQMVDTPMVSRAVTRVVLRPTRSPKCPKNADPIGRARNASANVARDCSAAVDGSPLGKNNLGNTRTAAVA